MSNKWTVMVLIALLWMLPLNNIVLADTSAHTILEYRHDVTGDGKPEKITLFGIRFANNAAYYKKIWAEIAIQKGKHIKINYEGGYEPKLEFADLNHDGVDDILYSSATGGSGGLYNYALHTVKNAKRLEIPLPEGLQIEGSFQKNFKAVLQIPGIKKPIRLDLRSRKADYLRLGLYQKNGLLNEPTELMIDPIAFFDVVKMDKGYGLKSYRQVSGAYHADRLGTVETLWYYENGTWNPVDVQWKTK